MNKEGVGIDTGTSQVMRAEQVLHLQEGQKLRDFVLGRDGVNDPIKAAGHCLQRPLIISLKLRQLCSSDTPSWVSSPVC